MKSDKVAKGRHLLQMKINSGKHLENPELGLMKIPLEALHSIALQQIGEQESYIEELENELKQLRQKKVDGPVVMSHKDNVRIAESVRREKVICDIWKRFEESQRKNGELKRKVREVSTMYSCCLAKIYMLEEKLKQYENKDNQK